ncbi:META domain-containing protein [Pseudomonas sp. F1_0610]|uniref:META domain-containing protein n=1 Tax=Pseudomonas sp. F1_0610 TaxID=3114284 RepID=UPI0039C04B1F
MRVRSLLLSVLVGLVGCSTAEVFDLSTQLRHRNFILVQVNQQLIPEPSFVHRLSFGERLFVSGTMCNEFSGFAQIKGSKLQVITLQQTEKACVNPVLNTWDLILQRMLSQGAEVTWQGQLLILKQGDEQLTYQLRDYVF